MGGKASRLLGAGGTDHFPAASVYAASNLASWARAVTMPGIQAAANILLLEHQKKQYNEIADQQRQLVDMALSSYTSCIDNLLPTIRAAYGEVPVAAEYVPVDPCKVLADVIACNQDKITDSAEWAECLNAYHVQQDITRAVTLDPRFLANIELTSISVQDLLRGKLPIGDIMEVMTDTAETAALQGRIGTCAHLTARNLGLSKLRAQARGRAEFRENMAFFNQHVSSVNRQVDLRSMIQTPQELLAFFLTQNQIIQNSLQNVNNANASRPPGWVAEAQARLSHCNNSLQALMGKALLNNSFVPNYAAILQPQINAVAQRLFDSKGQEDLPRNIQSSYNTPSEGGNFYQRQYSSEYVTPQK